MRGGAVVAVMKETLLGKISEGIFVKSAMTTSEHDTARHVKHRIQSWPK